MKGLKHFNLYFGYHEKHFKLYLFLLNFTTLSLNFFFYFKVRWSTFNKHETKEI